MYSVYPLPVHFNQCINSLKNLSRVSGLSAIYLVYLLSAHSLWWSHSLAALQKISPMYLSGNSLQCIYLNHHVCLCYGICPCYTRSQQSVYQDITKHLPLKWMHYSDINTVLTYPRDQLS